MYGNHECSQKQALFDSGGLAPGLSPIFQPHGCIGRRACGLQSVQLEAGSHHGKISQDVLLQSLLQLQEGCLLCTLESRHPGPMDPYILEQVCVLTRFWCAINVLKSISYVKITVKNYGAQKRKTGWQ